MHTEILEACIKKNVKQANVTLAHLKSLGFAGSNENAHAFLIAAINAIYNREHSTEELKKIKTGSGLAIGVDLDEGVTE